MKQIFSEKEMGLITDTLNSDVPKSYRTVLKSRIVNKLNMIKLSIKNLIPSKINNMRIRELLDTIGKDLYPQVAETIITKNLNTKKRSKEIEHELEQWLINQRTVLQQYIDCPNLNSKMKKILKGISKDIRRKGHQ